MAQNLSDSLLHLRELAAELLEQLGFTLCQRHELLLHQLHARKHALLDSLDGRSHVGEGRFAVPPQGLLICAESLQVPLEDARTRHH